MPPITTSQPAPLATPMATAMAPRWRVQLLGQVLASSAQRQVSRWPTRAVALLLARLALAPLRAHAREELVELLWPDLQAAAGRARLRQALSQLRSLLEPAGLSLPPVLLADRQTVRVAPGALVCDVHQFEHCATIGQAAAARALYLGELMPGHYDNWVQSERLRLQGLFEGLREPAAETGGAASARAPVPLPVSAVPDRATSAAAVVSVGMSAPCAAPDVNALRWPLPSLPGLPGPLSLGIVPSYWTRVFGRAAELARLQTLVTQARLVTVLGPGGSGKTRLVSEWVRRLLQDGGLAHTDQVAAGAQFERVVFVTLDSVRSLPVLQQTVRQALQPVWPTRTGSNTESTDTPGTTDSTDTTAQDHIAITAVLAAQPTLVVLDNVEQLLPEAEQALEQWLRAVPGLHLLLTSRRRLGLDGEHLLELPALCLVPPDADLTMAATNPAVALFVDRAQATRPDFHLTPGNLSAVVGLTRVLGGMPLAIELAASRLRALQPAELLQRLCAGAGSPQLDLLSRPALRAGLRSRHASMRMVVDWSWQQLRPELATLLRAMSVLSVPAPAEVLAQAGAALLQPGTSLGAVDLGWAQALLAEALESSLLVAQLQTGSPQAAPGTQYRLLPPVREYAQEQCTPAQARQVRSRVRLWLTTVLQDAEPVDPHALRSSLPLVPALILAAPAGPAVQEVLNRALAVATDPARCSGAHRLLSVLAMGAGQAEQALQHALQALQQAPDAARRAQAQVARSVAWLYQGGPADAAQQWLDAAWVDAQASADARVQITVLRTQALLAVNEYEDYAKAEPLVRRCLQLCEQCGDWSEFRIRQLDLASCLGWTGREAAAEALLQQSLVSARAAAESGVELPALVQLGRVQLRQRAWAGAEAALQQAIHQAQLTQQRAYMMWALLHLPAAWVMRGRAEDAALLQGYAVPMWERDFGAINRIESRELRRARRILGLALGAARARALMQAGSALSLPQVLAWLDPPAAPVTPARRADTASDLAPTT